MDQLKMGKPLESKGSHQEGWHEIQCPGCAEEKSLVEEKLFGWA